jgi:hypothetical protein
MPATHRQKHEARRHLVVAEALIHGYNAYTVGNTLLVDVNGRSAEVHVTTMGGWQLGDIEKFLAAATEFVIFVDLTETAPENLVPEFFIAEGDQARSVLGRSHDEWLKSRGGVRPRTPQSKHSLIQRHQVEGWGNRWALFER